MINNLKNKKLVNCTRWIYEHRYCESNSSSIFCFPFAGGNTHSFVNWINFVPKNYNLLAFQYPGRQTLINLPLERNLEDLVAQLFREIQPYIKGKKVVFFGHSLGSLVAFELAKKLEKSGKVLEGIFVSACVSPDKVIKERGIHHLSDEQFLKKIIGYEGTPKDILNDKDLMNYFLPILKADFCMYETYKFNPNEKLSCPVYTLGSERDPYAPFKEMKNWKETTINYNHLVSVTGNHFYINDESSTFTGIFLELLRHILEKKIQGTCEK